ncbi:MAG: hypothetical protein M3162_07535 [Thermoproteota archaeon]|nr:hypothetical protein [Thermoproteota archaeon]
MIVSTILHMSQDDLNHPLVFAKYADSGIWIVINFRLFVGTIMVLVGGFGAVHRLLIHRIRNASALVWFEF